LVTYTYFNDQKKKYIDAAGAALLSKIVTKPDDPSPRQTKSGKSYLDEKNVINLGQVTGPLDIYQEDIAGNLVERFRGFENEKTGFEKDTFQEIYSLARQLLKDANIRMLISQKIIIDIIFNWAVSYHREEHNLSLSDYLLFEFNKSIQEYNVYFPILFLESNKEFYIGIVTFRYTTEEYIETLSQNIDSSKKDNYKQSLKQHKGQLMASCCVQAEESRAIELAAEQVSLSIDVLRLFSPTVEVPDFKIYYDADYRNIHQINSTILIQPTEHPESLTLSHVVNPRPFVVNRTAWDIMNEYGIGHVHTFILRTANKKTELEELIYNAIQNFSKAIAMHDLHERVVEVFTVLESLLLPDDTSPIIDSVCRYLPRLVTPDIEERKMIIATIKEMYKVRSSMVHHAKRRDFTMNQLMTVQICTRGLILNLISQTPAKQTKREILHEIDEKIISA
jgi:hypothetical protein